MAQTHFPFGLSPIKHEEILVQFPLQTTNISILQSSAPDQMVNYAPILQTFPAQTENYVYDVESAAPLLLLTPITTPNGSQTSTNDGQSSNPTVEISPHGSFFNEVSVNKHFLFVFHRMESAEQMQCHRALRNAAPNKKKEIDYFRHFFPTFESFYIERLILNKCASIVSMSV